MRIFRDIWNGNNLDLFSFRYTRTRSPMGVNQLLETEREGRRGRKLDGPRNAMKWWGGTNNEVSTIRDGGTQSQSV